MKNIIKNLMLVAAAFCCASISSANEIAKSVFKNVSPSVVMVMAKTSSGEMQGSAVAFEKRCQVYSNNGKSKRCNSYLHTRYSTNAYVVGDSDVVHLVWGNKRLSGKVIYKNTDKDLAIIESLGDSGLTVQPIMGKRARVPEVGETVFAIGAPLGLQRTLSEGIISGLRVIGEFPAIQTTAAISPGSSAVDCLMRMETL